MEKHNKGCSCENGNIFQTVLLVILVVLSAFQVAFMLNLTPNFNKNSENKSTGMEKVVRDALLEHEYAKVGGKENYETITALQIAMLTNPQSGQDISTYKQMLEQLKNGSTTTTTTPTVTADTSSVVKNKIDDEQKNKIIDSAVVEGDKGADILVVEYSEMECPYCAQQYHDTQVKKNLSAEFGDKVAFAYKNNRGVNHEGTEVKALGLLCTQKIAGNEAYVKFYEYVMDRTTLRQRDPSGTVFPVASLTEAAKAAGVEDIDAWQSCVDKKEALEKFTAETREANQLGLRGTPGTLVLNTKTGEYATVIGAHPYTEFQKTVNALLQ